MRWGLRAEAMQDFIGNPARPVPMTGPDPALMDQLLARLRAAVAGRNGLLVAGICGAQGSGKSTLCAGLEDALGAAGIRAATLSLDDLYLTRAERLDLARRVHPLFATRGVPGTHDVALGVATIEALARGEATRLPRFDKGMDDRAPRETWPLAPARLQVLLFEGWCLGARPQDRAALDRPINALEAGEDPEGTWRRHANAVLGSSYSGLFVPIDLLVLLAAPGWEVVAAWREEQEEGLRTAGAVRAMSKAEVRRFIQFYERLTRWILDEMPNRADFVARLGPSREVLAIA